MVPILRLPWLGFGLLAPLGVFGSLILRGPRRDG
jgi:hypothetical protein